MKIKINQLSSLSQISRWRSKVDIVGIGVCRADSSPPPWIPLATAHALRSQLTGARLAVALNPQDGFDLQEVVQILTDLKADYFEYTPVDFAKRVQFGAELDRIADIAFRKIANGYFLQRDDCGFIDEHEPFLDMMRAGVELFQFDIHSAIDASFTLSPADLHRADRFFAQVPALVGDRIAGVGDYPLGTTRGFFFNIATSSAAPGYDYSLSQWTEADVLRVLSRR